MIQKLIDKLFRDKNGKIVIAQAPNPPLYLAMGLYLLGLIPYELFSPISYWGFRGILLYWSYLEITSGVNLFRKILGLLVCFWIIATL